MGCTHIVGTLMVIPAHRARQTSDRGLVHADNIVEVCIREQPCACIDLSKPWQVLPDCNEGGASAESLQPRRSHHQTSKLLLEPALIQHPAFSCCGKAFVHEDMHYWAWQHAFQNLNRPGGGAHLKATVLTVHGVPLTVVFKAVNLSLGLQTLHRTRIRCCFVRDHCNQKGVQPPRLWA